MAKPTEAEMRSAQMTVSEMFHELQRLQRVEAAALVLAREDPITHGLREDTVGCFYCDGQDSRAAEPLQHSPDCPYAAFWETQRRPFDYKLSLDEVKAKSAASPR